MLGVYQRFTLANLKSGAATYLRVSSRFWVFWVASFLTFSSIAMVPDSMWDKGIESIPKIRGWSSFCSRIVGAILILAAVSPILSRLGNQFAKQLESEEYQRRYAILSSLDRFNRGLVLLLSSIIFFFWFKEGYDFADTKWLWIISISLVLGSLMIALAFYGWMAGQLGEDHGYH